MILPEGVMCVYFDGDQFKVSMSGPTPSDPVASIQFWIAIYAALHAQLTIEVDATEKELDRLSRARTLH